MKKIVNTILGIVIAGVCSANLFAAADGDDGPEKNQSGRYLSVAYVQATTKEVPDPTLMTNIFYADCHIDSTLAGLEVPNVDYLKQIVALKQENPDLKISFSVGDSQRREGFCELAGDPELRRRFAEDCRRKMDLYGIDGIDLDWEFPGHKTALHNATPEDAANYVQLVKDLRKELGEEKLITFYSFNTAAFMDFKAMMPYVDYVMASGYNLGMPPKRHQSNLYPSEICGDWSVSQSVKRHIEKGVPPAKLMVGVPFYARSIPLGSKGFTYEEYDVFSRYLERYLRNWDDVAKAPYFMNDGGEMVAAYDNEESIRIKGKFMKDSGLAGMFYWHYGADGPGHALAKTVKAATAAD